MPIWLGRTGNLQWSVHHAAVAMNDWERYVDAVRQFLDDLHAEDKYGAVITFAWQSPAPDAHRRKLLAAAIQGGEHAKRNRAHAFVTDSLMLRGVLTALDWLVAKPYEEKIFSAPTEAVEWIVRKTTDVSAHDLMREMRKAVPPEHWPPGLFAQGHELSR